MKLRRTIRITLATAVALYVWAALSAVQNQTPGWPIYGLTAAAILTLITIALHRRRSA
jgi:hypothetical protein